MKPIRIDFAPRSLTRALQRTSLRTWFIGGAGLLLCISAVWVGLDLNRQHRAQQTSLQQLQTALSERTTRVTRLAATKKFAILESQASAVNGAIAQLNLPWRDVFDAIESATPATVALLALEPDAKKHLLKGIAEAKHSDDMIAYVELLKRQAFFSNVALTKHEVNEQDPNRPLRFQFEANWIEAVR